MIKHHFKWSFEEGRLIIWNYKDVNRITNPVGSGLCK